MAKYSKAIQLFLAVSLAVTTASCSDAKTTNGGGEGGEDGKNPTPKSEQTTPVTNPTASVNPSEVKNKAKEGGEGDESGSKDGKKPTPKKTGEGGEGGEDGQKPTPKKTGEGGEGGEK